MSNIRHRIRRGADGTESEGEVQRCSRGGGSGEELCYRAKGGVTPFLEVLSQSTPTPFRSWKKVKKWVFL